MSAMATVATSDIHRHPLNPRRPVTDAGDLVGSVATHGILTPLTVITDPDGGYLLIAGERRLTAAAANGLPTVPVHVRDDLTELAAVEALVMDNLQRQDLSPAEEARGYQCLLELGLDIDTIAARVGRPVKHVTDHAKASALNPGAIEVLHAHVVTLDQALELAALDDRPDLMEATLDKLSKGGNPSQIIRDAINARDRDLKTATVQEYATTHGIAFLPADGYDYNRMSDLTGNKSAVKSHKGLACYAVSPAYYHGSDPVRHVCTQPRAHKGATADAPVANDEDREASRETRRLVIANNRRFEDMNTIRREWLATFSQRATPPKVYLPQVVSLIARHSPSGRLSSQTHGRNGLDIAALTPARAAMMLINAVCDEVESGLDKTLWRTKQSTTAEYLATLATWGYPLTEPERLYVETVQAGNNPEVIDYSADAA